MLYMYCLTEILQVLELTFYVQTDFNFNNRKDGLIKRLCPRRILFIGIWHGAVHANIKIIFEK